MLDSPAHYPEEHFPIITAFPHTDCPSKVPFPWEGVFDELSI
jgi:hypothetical protein